MSSYSKNCIWERPSGRFLRLGPLVSMGGFYREASFLPPSFSIFLFSQLAQRCQCVAQVASTAQPEIQALMHDAVDRWHGMTSHENTTAIKSEAVPFR